MNWWQLEEALTQMRLIRSLVFDHADEWIAITGTCEYFLSPTQDDALRISAARGWWGPNLTIDSPCMLNQVGAFDLRWLAGFDDAEAEYRSWHPANEPASRTA